MEHFSVYSSSSFFFLSPSTIYGRARTYKQEALEEVGGLNAKEKKNKKTKSDGKKK